MKIEQINEDNFADKINSGSTVVVKMTATWCAPCKALQPILEKVADNLPDNHKIYSVDIDDCPNLTSQYKIRSVPTLLIFKDGQLSTATSGSLDITKVKSLF